MRSWVSVEALGMIVYERWDKLMFLLCVLILPIVVLYYLMKMTK